MKKKYTTPISIIQKMIANGELGQYSNKKMLGGIMAAANQLMPVIKSLNTKLDKPVQSINAVENVNPYGYRKGGKHEPNGFKQYNAPSHEQGGQMINDSGTPTPNGESEIEGTENKYQYSNIPKKEAYIFSDVNGTSQLVKDIIAKRFKSNPDLDTPTKNLQEFQIQQVENLNESINSLHEQEANNKFAIGGNLPTRINGIDEVTSRNNNIPPLNLNPIQSGAQRLMSQQQTGSLQTIRNNTITPKPVSPSSSSSNPLPSFDEALRGVSLGLNASQLFNKPEKESLITPDYSSATDRFNKLNANLDASRQEVLSGQNANTEAIRSASSSYQQQLSRQLQNTANTTSALNNVSLQEQNLRNNMLGQQGQFEANKASTLSRDQYQNRLDNLQNSAQNRNIKRSVLGDVVSESDRLSTIKNNKDISNATSEETKAILKSMYPDFEINDEFASKAQQLSRGEITNEEYQEYVDQYSPIKYKQ